MSHSYCVNSVRTTSLIFFELKITKKIRVAFYVNICVTSLFGMMGFPQNLVWMKIWSNMSFQLFLFGTNSNPKSLTFKCMVEKGFSRKCRLIFFCELACLRPLNSLTELTFAPARLHSHFCFLSVENASFLVVSLSLGGIFYLFGESMSLLV